MYRSLQAFCDSQRSRALLPTSGCRHCSAFPSSSRSALQEEAERKGEDSGDGDDDQRALPSRHTTRSCHSHPHPSSRVKSLPANARADQLRHQHQPRMQRITSPPLQASRSSAHALGGRHRQSIIDSPGACDFSAHLRRACRNTRVYDRCTAAHAGATDAVRHANAGSMLLSCSHSSLSAPLCCGVGCTPLIESSHPPEQLLLLLELSVV